jgi:hypothetical protein
VAATPLVAHADATAASPAAIVFARGGALYRADVTGKQEQELAPLPAKASSVRALRTDARGRVLLADIDGTWYWLPLATSPGPLRALPCGDGPAQLAPDGTCVVCRGAKGPLIVQLASGRQTAIDLPGAVARVAGEGRARRLVWTDDSGVWTAPPARPRDRTQVAPEAPLRSFLPSHDGARAVGVYRDFVYERRQKQPADMLMTFALDGVAARRKAIRDAVPLEWSFDNQYVLVQDGAAACLMRANGGQYKCWRGYTAVSIAPDASYALLLGGRDRKLAPPPRVENPDDDSGSSGVADVAVPLPTGPLSLYRGKLEGPHDGAPELVIKIVDGAATWVPSRP